jgi:hypothetical protein
MSRKSGHRFSEKDMRKRRRDREALRQKDIGATYLMHANQNRREKQSRLAKSNLPDINESATFRRRQAASSIARLTPFEGAHVYGKISATGPHDRGRQ